MTVPLLKTVDDYIDVDLTHSLHTSERKSFRGCRRRWNWLFRGYYYPKSTAKPLEFGVAYHKAMEIMYEPTLWNKPREAVLEMAIQEFRRRCREQLVKYESYHGAADPEVVKDYEERMEMGEGMLRYHHREVMPRIREEYKPVKVEVSFEVPIEDADGEQLWCTCDTCWNRFGAYHKLNHVEGDNRIVPRPLWVGLPVTYGGRCDAVMQRLDDGTQWIFDWKTAAQLSVDREEFLLLDDQISSYVWAFRVLGIQCSGFVYVEQKKADGAEPEPMKSTRLGRRFSVSKSTISCTAEAYKKTVEENDPEAYLAGLYDEFIEYLKEHNKLHAMYVIHRNNVEIAQTGKMIALEAGEMINPNLPIYPNAGRFSCGNCAFRQPCLSENDGGDTLFALETLFEKRRYHYWVDTEASTESKGGT